MVASNEGIAHSHEQQFAQIPSSSATANPIFGELDSESILDILQLELDPDFLPFAPGNDEEVYF